MRDWNAWLDTMGAAALDRGQFVGKSSTVTADAIIGDGGANPVSGVMILQAHDLNAALEICKHCPHVTASEGSIEIAPIIEM